MEVLSAAKQNPKPMKIIAETIRDATILLTDISHLPGYGHMKILRSGEVSVRVDYLLRVDHAST